MKRYNSLNNIYVRYMGREISLAQHIVDGRTAVQEVGVLPAGVDMHIVRSKFKAASGKVYETILLRESYREGKKVKKRTIANLTNCSPDEIAAIELALKYKGNLGEIGGPGEPEDHRHPVEENR